MHIFTCDCGRTAILGDTGTPYNAYHQIQWKSGTTIEVQLWYIDILHDCIGFFSEPDGASCGIFETAKPRYEWSLSADCLNQCLPTIGKFQSLKTEMGIIQHSLGSQPQGLQPNHTYIYPYFLSHVQIRTAK